MTDLVAGNRDQIWEHKIKESCNKSPSITLSTCTQHLPKFWSNIFDFGRAYFIKRPGTGSSEKADPGPLEKEDPIPKFTAWDKE